jgi:hypothetical protein
MPVQAELKQKHNKGLKIIKIAESGQKNIKGKNNRNFSF